MQHFLSPIASWFPVWYTTRAAGLTSYLLLFLSMVAGILQSIKWFSPRTRSVVYVIHQSCGWFGLLFGMVHGLILLYDQHVGYSLAEISIPFSSHDQPLATGVGTIAFYLMLLLVVSSDIIKYIGKKVWRSIHFLAFPAYLLALYHGIALGSDTQFAWAQIMYTGTGGIVTALVLLRISIARSQKNAAVPNKRIRSS